MGLVLTVFVAFDSFKPETGMNGLCFSREGVDTEITVKSVKYVKCNIVTEGVASL